MREKPDNRTPSTATTELRVAPISGLEALAAHYRAHGRVQVRDVLELGSADAIHDALVGQKEWNLVYTHRGEHVAASEQAVARWTPAQRRKLEKAIYAQAERGFQYFYATVPVYDIYHRRLLPGHVLNRVFELLNSGELLSLVRTICTDSSIGFADAQATRYGPGHFLTCHDDAVAGKNRRVAYVLNLTPLWRPDWGGALQFFGPRGDVVEAYTPRYNALNLFRVPSDHSVGIVAPFAGASRYSVTGWFRAGVDPGPDV